MPNVFEKLSQEKNEVIDQNPFERLAQESQGNVFERMAGANEGNVFERAAEEQSLIYEATPPMRGVQPADDIDITQPAEVPSGRFKVPKDTTKLSRNERVKNTLDLKDIVQGGLEPDFMGEAVGEPSIGAKALQVPFILGHEIATGPGAFTEAEPFEIERKEASISDLGGQLGRKLLGEGAATETLPYNIFEKENFGDMGESIGRLVVETGVEIGVANVILRALAGSINSASKLFKESVWWRKATIPERQLVVQSLDDVIRKNSKMSEGEILRKYEGLKKEATVKRAKGEVPLTEKAKLEEAPIEKAPETKSVEKIYRRGRKDGRWWTSEKDYADIFGENRKLQTKEIDTGKLNILDSRTDEGKFLNNLSEKGMDKALTERGYDGFLGEGEKGEPIYYFPKVKSPKITKTPTKEQQLLDKVTKTAGEKVQIGTISLDINAPTKPTDKFKFQDPKIEGRYTKAKDYKEPIANKIKNNLINLRNKLTRVYEHLPNTGEFAEAKNALLKLAKQKGVKSEQTLQMLRGVTNDLNSTDYDLLARKLILADLVETANLNPEAKLPYGFTKETTTAELKNLDEHIKDNKAVQAAVKDRTELFAEIVDNYKKSMSDIGMDVEKRFKRKNYFRHQVLEYAKLKGLRGSGSKLKKPTGGSHLKKRKSESGLDIGSDYLQAEHEVLAQMLYDIEVGKTIKLVDTNYNIIKQLRKEAKKLRKEGQVITWEDLVPEEYTTWQAQEGNVFYLVDSIPAKLATQLAENAFENLGINMEDFKKVLAMGGKRKQFVIRKELAETLDNLIIKKTQNPLIKVHQKAIRSWKLWQLISPRRWAKYNIRNLTGDADAAFVGSARIFAQSPRAVKDLYEYYVNDKPMTGDLKDWFERGGTQGTLQVQEMGDINRLGMFIKLNSQKTQFSKIPLTVWQKYWKTARLSTDFREAILRYAAYLEAERVQKTLPNEMPWDFWASNPKEIKGLSNRKDRSYWLANDLLGAYDKVGVIGQSIREHLYPFWSWKEVNFKRYARMFSNAANEGQLLKLVGRKSFTKLLKTPYTAWRISKWLIRATAFWTMLQVWNHTMFPEEEMELPKDVRQRPHVVLGRNKDGTIDYFSRLGALGDLLEWFGLDNIPEYTRKWLEGKLSVKEIVIEAAKAPANVLIQGSVPFIKLGGELLTRRALFPSIYKPGTIRDRWMHVFKSFGLENEYRVLADKPRQGYLKSLKKSIVYQADPYQSAYYDILQEKYAFLKRLGKSSEGFWLTPKGNALYDAKLALKYKDQRSAVNNMAKYFNLGGTMQGLKSSLDTMDPLAGLTDPEKLVFVAQLSDENKTRLIKSMIFYQELAQLKFEEE